jgi:L,D-transpeptidase catalytic domain
VRAVLGLTLFFCAGVLLRAETSVEIDLQEQRGYLLQNGRPVLASPISSGRYGHLTKTGSFRILDKERSHYSSMYGKIVDASGNTVVADADADMQVPRGGKFIPAPMHYFMRFNGGDGMHAGYLPGYPASRGCVRMPEQDAIAFLMPCRSGLPLLCSAGRQLTATTQANRNRVFRAVHVSAHSWVRGFRLHHLLQCGGGK